MVAVPQGVDIFAKGVGRFEAGGIEVGRGMGSGGAGGSLEYQKIKDTCVYLLRLIRAVSKVGN